MNHTLHSRTQRLFSAAVLLMALGACVLMPGAATPTPQADHPLQGTVWFLITMGPANGPQPIFPDSIVSLEFDHSNGIRGSGGCNSYTGTVTIQGQTITLSNLASDLMACAQPALLDQEGGYYDALNSAESYLLTASALTIFYAGGNALHFADSPPGGAAPTATVQAPTPFPSLTPKGEDTAEPAATLPPSATATSAPTQTVPPEAGAKRIRFDTGAISAEVSGELDPAESDLYVLYVLEGQTMTVELDFNSGEAILVIWGANGTVLVTDHIETSSAEVEIPSSQDYFIMVKGDPNQSTEYTLTITIPPPE